MPISKLLLAVVPALALLPAGPSRHRGPAPLRTATLETVVEPPEEPRNTYWCVRHGQSTANVENIISSNPAIGSTKHELTALGKEQAHVAGADLWANLSELEVALEDVVVYSSNFTRARETAQIAAYEMQRRAQIAAGDWEAPPLLQIGLLSDLRERDFGSLDGLSAGNYDNVWPRDMAWPFDGTDGVEPVADVCQRLSNMVDLLEKRHSGKQVILTAHADVIQIFQTWFAGCDVRAFSSYRLANGEVRRCDRAGECLPVPAPMQSQAAAAL